MRKVRACRWKNCGKSYNDSLVSKHRWTRVTVDARYRRTSFFGFQPRLHSRGNPLSFLLFLLLPPSCLLGPIAQTLGQLMPSTISYPGLSKATSLHASAAQRSLERSPNLVRDLQQVVRRSGQFPDI